MRARTAIAAIALVAAGVPAAPARAGSYEVKFCDGVGASATPASPDARGFVVFASDSSMHNSRPKCPTNADPLGGMAQRNTLNKGIARQNAFAVRGDLRRPGWLRDEL